MNTRKSPCKGNDSGFTLIEVALAIAVLSILLVSVSSSLGVFRETTNYKETERYLEKARQALQAYVVVNGHLPCPDTDGDGDESDERCSNTCADWWGQLPYLSLGLGEDTPWQQPAFYAVHQSVDSNCGADLSQPQCFFSLNGFDLTTDASIGTPLSVSDFEDNTVATQIVAVVGSFGTNSRATFLDCEDGSRSDHELSNCDAADSIFIHGYLRSKDAANGFFDDQLIWLDALTLKVVKVQQEATNVTSSGAPPVAAEPTSCTGISNCLEGSDSNDNSYDNSPGSNGTLFGSPDGTIIAKDGNDRIEGGSGNQEIYAGNGNDVIFGGSGSDKVFGGDGNDLFIRYANESGVDIVDGGAGVDRIDLECEGGDSVEYIVGDVTTPLRSQDGIVSIGDGVMGEIKVNGQLIIQFSNMETLRAFTYSGPCN